MPTFKHSSGKRVFFAHIPRTAGRFVEANLSQNDFKWNDAHLDNGKGIMSIVNGFEVAHYHRDHYMKYLDVKDIPHFSIVRNPIDRFISASIYIKRFCGDKAQEGVEDKNSFLYVLKSIPYRQSLNWFRPQIDFLRSDTHIWKFEDGFGEDFVSWLSGIVGIDLEFTDDVEYAVAPDEGNKLEKTPQLIDTLIHFYKQDIEQFYPELAA
tara:strand:- start:567 stop:1193 length:627 start_codon:yes stop_codon:yes gene_type:complete